MSTNFFSHHRPSSGGLAGAAPAALERQQTLVLRALSAAAGEAVSYAQLRDAGVEFPASVVSELELAGVRVERCYEHTDGARMAVGVRLGSAHALALAQPSLPSVAERIPSIEPVPVVAQSTGVWRRMLSDGAYVRWLASWAAVVGVAAVALLAIVGLTGGGGSAGKAGVARTRRVASRAPARTPREAAPVARAAPVPTRDASVTRVAASPALAAQLEAQGHELVQSGQYAQAIAVLKKALAATGESLDGCVQPTSETCLTYAYALYDLGRALRLNGSAAAAVGVLEHRLQIENQRPVVAEELAFARQQLG